MKVAREGYPLILTFAAVSLLTLVLGWTGAAWVIGIFALAIAAFFRDPERTVPPAEGLIVSPADGKVVSIATVAGDATFTEAVTRVSIFLSPLDVHINRMPVAGEIRSVNYKRGSFMAAYKEEASSRNEQNALAIDDGAGKQFGIVQIAGALVRRIVCHAKPGDSYGRGDRFGLIMFGSRTDAYLPKGCRVEVVEGQHVKGGETILGRYV